MPSHSAVLPGYIPIPIRSNHVDMTKFENTEDPGFIAVVGELRRWVRDLSAATQKDIPKTEPLRRKPLVQMAQSLSISEEVGIQDDFKALQIQNSTPVKSPGSESQNIGR